MKDLINVMKGPSDLNRVKIWKSRRHGRPCVIEMLAVFRSTQPTVSSHLEFLEEAGRVRFREKAPRVNQFASSGSGSSHAASVFGDLKLPVRDGLWPRRRNPPGRTSPEGRPA